MKQHIISTEDWVALKFGSNQQRHIRMNIECSLCGQIYGQHAGVSCRGSSLWIEEQKLIRQLGYKNELLWVKHVLKQYPQRKNICSKELIEAVEVITYDECDEVDVIMQKMGYWE